MTTIKMAEKIPCKPWEIGNTVSQVGKQTNCVSKTDVMARAYKIMFMNSLRNIFCFQGNKFCFCSNVATGRQTETFKET